MCHIEINQISVILITEQVKEIRNWSFDSFEEKKRKNVIS